MEIIATILLVIGMWVFYKIRDIKACNYSQSHQIDWEKANHDRAINDLSNSQVNQNIINGKYDKPAAANKSSNDTWEGFKRRHPHGSWN